MRFPAMFRDTFGFALLRATLGFALLSGAPAVARAQSSAASRDAEAVKATLVQMWDAIESGDSARYAAFVHPDFTQFGENDPYLAEGKTIEVKSMGSYLRRAKNVHTDMHNAIVTVKGDVAWVTYYWTDSGETDGKKSSSHGKSTRIFVREGGRWLCIHGHYTNG